MKYSQDTIDRACELYTNGASIRATASRLNVSAGSVQYWLRRSGVSLRSKSVAMKGKPKSKEHIEKMRKTKTGSSLSDAHKAKISNALLGVPKSEEFCRQMSEGRRGENNPNYNPDRDKVERAKLGRAWWLGYGSWSKAVKARDGHACVCCSSDVELKSHHLDNFHDFEDKRTDIDNGVTLCSKCHDEFHIIYGRKGNTKEQFVEFYDKVTKCMKEMEGKVSDTGAFCASLADRVDPGWRSRD